MIRKPPKRITVNINASALKYLSMNSFMGSPYFFIKTATRKNLALLLINPERINIGNCIWKAPALIVNSLNGIGVNPAVKMIMKLYSSYKDFIF